MQHQRTTADAIILLVTGAALSMLCWFCGFIAGKDEGLRQAHRNYQQDSGIDLYDWQKANVK